MNLFAPRKRTVGNCEPKGHGLPTDEKREALGKIRKGKCCFVLDDVSHLGGRQ